MVGYAIIWVFVAFFLLLFLLAATYYYVSRAVQAVRARFRKRPAGA
jgi:hypothetical protein